MELLVALKTANDLASILILGPKLSGEAYSRDDKRVLTVVSRQVSAAFDNASGVPPILVPLTMREFLPLPLIV